MTATGFSARALTFFDGLEEDNSREYWDAHLPQFETEVKAPLAALLESMPTTYQKFRVFRMNRDLRFTKDKSPYKTAHSAIHETDGIDHYVQISAGGLLVASGVWWMSRDQLERYRAAVDDDKAGPALQRIVRKAERAGYDTDGGQQPLKTAPRGYPTDHERIVLLRRKGLIVAGTLTGPDLADGDAVRAFVLDVLAAGRPLSRWFAQHVGVAEDREEPGR